ncbi:hypothetical protein C1Y40_04941 [Mycobacterium talmoniae]|uniref:Uncharacterized protein n=1 Tax=Mycobacterium talmoniae TaxID=1858794 RepID=A0A2S8BDZ3_9MYCO|nr:hypothetical protein C1Y40_04941 [Mycobacterium talmoniae]
MLIAYTAACGLVTWKYTTVSIESVRLSSVITGCGGKDTTRSRRSTRARTRSMNGTSSVSCPLTVRL